MSQLTFDESIQKSEWMALAQKPGVKTHFLGSWAWGQVQARRGWTPYYVGVRRDGELAATALLLKKALYMGYCYFYIPRGFTMDYSDAELLEFITKSVAAFGKKHKAIYFKIDPDIKLHTIDMDGKVIEGEENSALVARLEKLGYRHRPLTYFFETEQPRFTFRIPLGGSIEEIEKRYSKTTKARIRHAEESCVEVFEGRSEDIKEFVRLMKMTEARQDFFSHEADFYQYFYDILSEDGMVTLYFGKVDPGKIRAGLVEKQSGLKAELAAIEGDDSKKAATKRKETEKVLVSVEKQLEAVADAPEGEVWVSTYLIVNYVDKAWALYAANDMNYGKFYANYEVYKQQIRDAKAKGLKIFDVFGTIGKPDSDSRLAGLYEFKKKWGGEYTEFVGEFDYVLNGLMYKAFKTLIPLYHKIRLKQLKKGK